MTQQLMKLRARSYHLLLILVVNFFFGIGWTPAYALQATAPRYAPGIVSVVQSHEYIREHKAPLYWKLSPYYTSQRNDSSCSLATAAMVVNAALASQTLYAKQSLATQNEILNRVKEEDWDEGVRVNGEGISLNQLRLFLEKALKAYGVGNFTIELVYTKDSSQQTKATLRKHLLDSEVNGQSVIVANFDQKFFTGDISVGHFAPVGAYDAEKKRVLIMDPDRKWYEPYWVPEKMFLKAMVTFNSDGKHYRGYLVIRFKSNSPTEKFLNAAVKPN